MLQRTKRDFRRDRNVPADQIEFKLQVGESHLDTVRAQTQHMHALSATPVADAFGAATLAAAATELSEAGAALLNSQVDAAASRAERDRVRAVLRHVTGGRAPPSPPDLRAQRRPRAPRPANGAAAAAAVSASN